MFPFFKAMWFYLKKAEFDLIKFAHTTAKAVAICCPENTVLTTLFLNNKPRVRGLGRGLRREGSRRRRARGTTAGLDHSDASLRGIPQRWLVLQNQGFFWIDGLNEPDPRRSLHNRCFICISLFPIYYLTGHSTSSQAEIDVNSAPRRNLDLHAQLLVLEMSLTSTLAASPVSLLYAPFSL